MNMWCHLPTGFKARRTLLAAALALLTVVITTSVIFVHTTFAAQSTNKTINFQGRLLNASGGTVPDGNYNLQFKIYQDGAGTTAGNPGGTLLWIESHINNGGTSGVKVKNGYFSVALGSVNSFGSSIDWEEETLWLSMNVAGFSSGCTEFGTSPCTGDGEMLPMKRLMATPYSINSGAVGGKSVDQLVQLGQGAQTDAGSTSSIFINKTGSGNHIQLQSNGTDTFTVNNAGSLILGSATNQSISVATAASGAGKELVVSAGGAATSSDLAGGDLLLQGGEGDGAGVSGNVIVKANGSNSSGTFQVQDSDGQSLFNVDTATSVVSVGTISFIPAIDDDEARAFDQISSENALSISSEGGLTIGSDSSATDIKGDTVSIGATSSITLQTSTLDVLTATTFNGQAAVGIGTSTPSAALHVATNNNSVNQPALLVEQQGSGDATIEIKDDSGKSFYVGMDKSDGSNFKISSSSSVKPSTDIGNTTAGGSITEELGNAIAAKKIETGEEQGTISSISVFVQYVDGEYPGLDVALYSHDETNNRPGSLLGATTGNYIHRYGWNTIPVSISVEANTTYWIAIKAEGTSAINYNYCFGCSGDSAYYAGRPFNDGWPNTAGAPTALSTNENYSWYATLSYGSVGDTYSGADLFSLSDTGALTLQNSTDSVNAFQIQNAAGSSVLNVDTTNNLITMGANVGIGGVASGDFALEVVGAINALDAYYINGNAVLEESALRFQGDSTSSIFAATGQILDLRGDTGVVISQGGETRISANNLNVEIGDGSSLNNPTLLTLDASPTIAYGILGSMYYDTTVGKVQCYEADGWGACSDAPDVFVSLSPEYANAVMNGADIGTISSDICSDALNINDGSSGQRFVCGLGETQNFYSWTSPEFLGQTRSIFVSYQLPSTFTNFVSGTTKLMGLTDSSGSSVSFRVYRDSQNDGLISCAGSSVLVSSGSQSSWQTETANSGNDPATCGFEAGDSILVRIDLTAQDDAYAYVSDLSFAYSNSTSSITGGGDEPE